MNGSTFVLCCVDGEKRGVEGEAAQQLHPVCQRQRGPLRPGLPRAGDGAIDIAVRPAPQLGTGGGFEGDQFLGGWQGMAAFVRSVAAP